MSDAVDLIPGWIAGPYAHHDPLFPEVVLYSTSRELKLGTTGVKFAHRD
jgi:hypothetical protein